MMPKIIFRYSGIYDEHWKQIAIHNPYFKQIRKSKYPSSKEILAYVKSIKILWKKYEKPLLKELSKISKLKWKSKRIICYIVGFCRPFSEPLTIPIYPKNKEFFIDVLTHELIHQNFIQLGNNKKSAKAWRYFFNKYKKESFTTIIHIPLHAIHYNIYKKLFKEERIKIDVQTSQQRIDYKKSWDIVLKEPEKILEEWRKRIK